MRLKDKVILVTASTRGIGLAIVKKCAEEGAEVYMAARDMERAREIASTLTGVKCVYNDATKPETFASMVEDVVQDAGRIDVLVNNAGVQNNKNALDYSAEEFSALFDTNVIGKTFAVLCDDDYNEALFCYGKTIFATCTESYKKAIESVDFA